MSNHTPKRRLGSLRQKPNGRWLAVIERGRKVDGTRRTMSKTFATRKDAEDWLASQSVLMDERPDLGAGITLETLWAIYEQNRLPELARSTQVGYVYQAQHNILPVLGCRDVSTITHGDIQRMLDTMRPSVARLAKATLSAVLTYGVKANIIAENVMRRAPFTMPEQPMFADADAAVWDTDPFAAIEERRDVWDAPTISRCMERIRGLALEPVWLACVGAGLRVEEAFALRKMDVRRIVASYDEYGNEIWLTQLAIHHATTREETRKATKTTRSVGIVPMLEPFGERYWELVQGIEDKTETVCKLSAARQNKTWRAYFAAPPEEWHKRMSEERKVQGRLHDLPYIPLSRMRATHTTLVQEAGVLDSINRAWHRNTAAVQQRHYMRPDASMAALQVSSLLNI